MAGTATFQITPKSISDSSVTVTDIQDAKYTSAPIEPTFTVQAGSQTLTKEKLYYVIYKKNIDAGNGKVIITSRATIPMPKR